MKLLATLCIETQPPSSLIIRMFPFPLPVLTSLINPSCLINQHNCPPAVRQPIISPRPSPDPFPAAW